MSLDSLASNADIILRREADKRGFRARKLRIVEDSLSWAIIRENETLAILITNGEVFDLWIASNGISTPSNTTAALKLSLSCSTY